MALRVLLADESSTIKKVFQLALQDFAVDVRPVNLGIDVLAVARSFKPDIIFADILLQKQNGYDVAAQLKQDPDLGALPVVLMWSGFMKLDEDKFQASRADATLEKPFDVNQLRTLINELVPKTQSNRVSQYLKFPKMPEFKESEPVTPPTPADREEFTQVPLPKMMNTAKGRDKYRVDVQPTDDVDDIPVTYEMPSGKIEVDSLLSGNDELEEFSLSKPPQRSPPPPPPDLVNTNSQPKPQPVDSQQLEAIVLQQSREVIESVVWKIVPELATQIIERELARLLKEREANPY